MNIFVQWMTSLLKWLYSLTSFIGIPSYGIAIILLTIIIKSVIYPLTWKQMASMRKTADLQPKMQEIQKKYKSDPETMNAKVMELYKENNVNPASGCLPLVIQLPIFWALYSSLSHFGNYISDPSQAQFLWFDLTMKGSLSDPTSFILPVLSAASTFLQTKISTATSAASAGTGDKNAAAMASTQKSMLYIMPFFMGYITYTVPSGLGLYFVVMNVVSIFQQLYINRKLDSEKEKAAA
ncbi:YidC/Oxa1 family membrane protein insertase [Desulfitobacterium metallireducens]|uniref:Membrane protein n=1 Tax=Desulfitobacterium metallireducens DSM 15288 TaxID=871968 RepID=W0EH14_9FIRM|nr:YidC/Oxa1 family membrane protein insertase [Desulfitobacterium metallireducens]AHF08351.1 membrane protein [Desulfitobacterium metallireducens DSM 15288]